MGKRGFSGTIRRVALVLSLVVIGGVFASAARADDLPVTSAIPPAGTKIRVMVYNGAYTSLPVFIARDAGFYEKYHLDPELTVVASGPAGVAALLGGSLDFIEPPTDQIIENQVHGSDLRIIVGNEVRNFFDVVASSKLKLPHEAAGYPAIMQDLKGLRFGVNALGASTHLMMNALLKGAGLTPDDVTYVADGSSNTALAAWQADRIDAQVAFTPFPEIVQALGSGKSIINLSAGQGPALLQKLGGAFEDWSCKAAFIRAHPEHRQRLHQGPHRCDRLDQEPGQPREADRTDRQIRQHLNHSGGQARADRCADDRQLQQLFRIDC